MVVLGGVVDVAYLLDTPHGFDWKGVYIDAALRVTETIGSPEYCRLFMQLSSLQGSVLENKIFEDGFGVESISTAKLLGLANAGSVPLVVLDQGNVSIEMPDLNLPANISVDIENAINQGLKVTIPAFETQHEDWLGYGYLKENPATGESGWMLSGMLAGGMTALNPERWSEEYYDPLANPLQGEVNHDPDSAVELVVLAASEGQQGVAGKPLPLPLQLIARDAQMRPVPGVQVNFRVLAGGGILSQISVTSDSNGIASVDLTLGEHVSENPTTWYATPHNWTVGENIVDASTTRGLRLQNPITAFAFPGEPDHLSMKLKPSSSNSILYWAGPLGVKVEDRYGNNISNEPVTFSMGVPVSKGLCALPNNDNRPGLLAAVTDDCFTNKVPMYGECGTQSLDESTGEDGAAVQVFLGGVPDADYAVTIRATGAKSSQIPPQTITITTWPFGNCDGFTSPDIQGRLQDIGLVDQLGYAVNAVKVGGSVPIMARMYLIRELEGELTEGTLYCPDGVPNRTCQYPLGTRQYLIDTELSTDSYVSMAPSGGSFHATTLGNGLFYRDYPVGDIPGIYQVVVGGMAKTAAKVTLIEASCDAATGAGACGLVQGPVGAEVPWLIKNVIAVDIDLPRTSYLVPVDSEGYAITDTVLNYTILPYVPGDLSQSYIAGNAFVEIAKKKPDGSLEVVRYLDTERTGPGKAILARSFRFEPDSEYVARVVLNKASNAVEIRSNEISLKPVVVNLDLVPDYNRDGKIDEADKGKVTSVKPWRFWVNDDDDGDSDPATGLTTDSPANHWAKPDDLPGQNEDYGDNQVNGMRDLVDFFSLKLDLGQALTLLPPGDGYGYFLKNSEGALGMVEGLLTSGVASGTLLTADTAHEYLEDPATGIAFGEGPVQVVTAAGVKLSAPFLQKLKDNEQSGVFLLEGRKATAEPLTLEIRDRDGATVISQIFPLEIVPVEQMYGHKNLRSEAGAGDGEIDRFVNFTVESSPDFYRKAKQPYCMQGEDKNLVWMHGYNTSPEEARATYAEVFKRFFHAGLNGRFFGVGWYGNPPDGTPVTKPHYHQAVVNAFATSQAYKNFITAIPGSTSIAAHSLGNMVVGAAIQDKGLNAFAQYFAVDAAVALEAYGQVAVDDGMVNVGEWPSYLFAGQERLLASEWYKLFLDDPTVDSPSDHRSQLTWRNRLDKVPGNRVYNFYSSTEDVLRPYPDDNLLLDGNGWSWDALSISTWVKQEKFKGVQSVVNMVDNVAGVASSYCGWGFSSAWKKGTIIKRKYTPEEAATEISEAALKTEPFFAIDSNVYSTHALDAMVSADLTSKVPSSFVMKRVSEIGLKSYYTDNQPAQDKVTVKDWLLAEAFPATTLPMGANRYTALEGSNIDMSGVRDNDGGCCKTREDLWPRDTLYQSKKTWKHGDYNDVPYHHVYGFYSKIKQLSEQ